MQARRPRGTFLPDDHRRAVARFHAAATEGDVTGLLEVLAPDVELVTDGGGVIRAALRPIRGVDKVLRFLGGVMPQDGTLTADTVTVNGLPGLLLRIDGRVDSVVSLELTGGLPAAEGMIRELQLFTHAVSLGGVDSLVQHPASLTHRPVAPEARPGAGILRLSIGLEHVEDLWADLERGLAAAR